MTLARKFKRWLYGSCPGFKGSFPYWGERVYFPANSIIFALACEQGIFERENLRLLQSAIRPNSWYFDVGANIGLMSAPLLQTEPTLQVVSIEASPQTAAYLSRTIEQSPRKNRWRIIPKALGASEGEIEFFASIETHGVFDGIRDTGRGVGTRRVTVPVTTLDTLWTGFGCPDVSLIKVDVEGGEADVLRGAVKCMAASRPYILMEWNPLNLAAYSCPPGWLLEFARSMNYDLLNVPGLATIATESNLRLQTGISESFVLVPHS